MPRAVIWKTWKNLPELQLKHGNNWLIKMINGKLPRKYLAWNPRSKFHRRPCNSFHSYPSLSVSRMKVEATSYFQIFFILALQPIVGLYFTALYRAIASSRTRFLDHIERRATVSRTPLNEWSVRGRDLYVTTHNNHNRQTSMPRVGLEPTIAAGERP